LVDPNNNNWTRVFENAKHSVVKVAVSNSYMNGPEGNDLSYIKSGKTLNGMFRIKL